MPASTITNRLTRCLYSGDALASSSARAIDVAAALSTTTDSALNVMPLRSTASGSAVSDIFWIVRTYCGSPFACFRWTAAFTIGGSGGIGETAGSPIGSTLLLLGGRPSGRPRRSARRCRRRSPCRDRRR